MHGESLNGPVLKLKAFTSILYVIGYEKRDHITHFPNFHFKTFISLEPYSQAANITYHVISFSGANLCVR